MPQTDREVLRELAKQVAEIAALPVHQETIALWKRLNALKPVRPMVLMDQLPWHEMNVDDELTCRCQDRRCQAYERGLRQRLYLWKHMRVDMVVTAGVEVGKAYHSTGFGVRSEPDVRKLDPQTGAASYHYHDQLKTEADLERVHAPEITLDEKATAQSLEWAHSVFDGVAPVGTHGVSTMFNVWDQIVTLRGADKVLWDLADRPEFTHQIMRRFTDAHARQLDQFEALGLLEAAQPMIHCSGAYTDELPAPGLDPARPRAKDAWTCGMAQIFSAVSPAMHKEFDLDYLRPQYARFGLVYYGCCEPLDEKLAIIREIPGVRKISMSPWVKVARGAERIGRDFVFSRKPSPALLATDTFDPQAVEKDLRETMAACRKHGTPVEFILKDVSTVRYQPQRLWEWADIAMRVVKE